MKRAGQERRGESVGSPVCRSLRGGGGGRVLNPPLSLRIEADEESALRGKAASAGREMGKSDVFEKAVSCTLTRARQPIVTRMGRDQKGSVETWNRAMVPAWAWRRHIPIFTRSQSRNRLCFMVES